VGIPVAIAAAILGLIILTSSLLAFYSMRQANQRGGRTWIELRTAGVHFKFGSEISPTPGVRSADEQGQLKTESPPKEVAPGKRRRLPWLRNKRLPDGGEA
jgi:hypothetical protein